MSETTLPKELKPNDPSCHEILDPEDRQAFQISLRERSTLLNQGVTTYHTVTDTLAVC